jgi:hypothetical protein
MKCFPIWRPSGVKYSSFSVRWNFAKAIIIPVAVLNWSNCRPQSIKLISNWINPVSWQLLNLLDAVKKKNFAGKLMKILKSNWLKFWLIESFYYYGFVSDRQIAGLYLSYSIKLNCGIIIQHQGSSIRQIHFLPRIVNIWCFWMLVIISSKNFIKFCTFIFEKILPQWF